MAEFPALPLWTDSYLGDTRHLSTLEHGAYLLLLMEAWRRPLCSLPDDDALLARLAGVVPDVWDGIRTNVMGFWKLDGRTKTWSQKRLSSERAYVARKSRVQSDNAAKRWDRTKKHDAMAMPTACQLDAPTPTPTPSSKIESGTESGELPLNLENDITTSRAEARGGQYAFEGRVIRLNQRDWDNWRATFSTVRDLRSELMSLDAWFTEQPKEVRDKWFHRAIAILNKRHQENLRVQEEENAEPEHYIEFRGKKMPVQWPPC